MNNALKQFYKNYPTNMVERQNRKIKLDKQDILKIGTMFLFSKSRKNQWIKCIFVLTKKTLFYVKGKVEKEEGNIQFSCKAKIELNWVRVRFTIDEESSFNNDSFLLNLEKNSKRVSFKISNIDDFKLWKNKFKGIGIRVNFMDTYQVASVIGQGKTTTVYKVKNKKTNQMFACKKINKEKFNNKKSAKELLNEIKILKLLKGKSEFVQFEEMFENEKYLFVVMELCEGGKAVRSKEKSCYESVCFLADRLFKTLKTLEDLKIVHRNLNSSCFLLKNKNTPLIDNEIKLINFKLAYCEEDTEVLENNELFTFDAPEILTGNQQTPSYKSDIFSVGIIIYNSLTGRRSILTKERIEELQRNNLPFVNLNGCGLSGKKKLELEVLLNNTLNFDLEKRSNAEAVLESSFFKETEEEDQTKMASRYSFKIKSLKGNFSSKFAFSEKSSKSIFGDFDHLLNTPQQTKKTSRFHHRYSYQSQKSCQFMKIKHRTFTIKKSLFVMND